MVLKGDSEDECEVDFEPQGEGVRNDAVGAPLNDTSGETDAVGLSVKVAKADPVVEGDARAEDVPRGDEEGAPVAVTESDTDVVMVAAAVEAGENDVSGDMVGLPVSVTTADTDERGLGERVAEADPVVDGDASGDALTQNDAVCAPLKEGEKDVRAVVVAASDAKVDGDALRERADVVVIVTVWEPEVRGLGENVEEADPTVEGDASKDTVLRLDPESAPEEEAVPDVED